MKLKWQRSQKENLCKYENPGRLDTAAGIIASKNETVFSVSFLLFELRKLTTVGNTQRCYKKRVNWLINGQIQTLLKYRSEFPEHGRTSYHINGRNLIAFQEFFCDQSHFFYGGLDHWKNFFLFIWLGFQISASS